MYPQTRYTNKEEEQSHYSESSMCWGFLHAHPRRNAFSGKRGRREWCSPCLISIPVRKTQMKGGNLKKKRPNKAKTKTMRKLFLYEHQSQVEKKKKSGTKKKFYGWRKGEGRRGVDAVNYSGWRRRRRREENLRGWLIGFPFHFSSRFIPCCFFTDLREATLHSTSFHSHLQVLEKQKWTIKQVVFCRCLK